MNFELELAGIPVNKAQVTGWTTVTDCGQVGLVGGIHMGDFFSTTCFGEGKLVLSGCFGPSSKPSKATDFFTDIFRPPQKVFYIIFVTKSQNWNRRESS